MARNCTLYEDAAVDLIKTHVRALRRQLGPVRRHDPEGVHDMRVASRRLRVTLTEHAKVLAKPHTARLGKRVRRITRTLGKPRELDVTLAVLEKHRKELHGAPRYALNYLVRWLRAQRRDHDGAIAKGITVVESSAFEKLLMALFENRSSTKKCYLKSAARRLKARYRDLTDAYKEWQGTRAEEALHQLRIAFKKLRYTCEAYKSLYGRKMNGFIEQVKTAQQDLGDWNDYRVLRDYASEASTNAPARASEGMAELQKALDNEVTTLLDHFQAAAADFFAPERQKQIKAFFNAPTQPCCRNGR